MSYGVLTCATVNSLNAVICLLYSSPLPKNHVQLVCVCVLLFLSSLYINIHHALMKELSWFQIYSYLITQTRKNLKNNIKYQKIQDLWYGFDVGLSWHLSWLV